jgi:hypothetical protein
MRFAASPAPSFADKDRRTKLAALGPQLDALVSDRLPPSKFPGVAIGLVVDGDLVWSKALGVSDLASGRPVDLDTIFRLGSLTKSFTAEAVLALRDEADCRSMPPPRRTSPSSPTSPIPRETPSASRCVICSPTSRAFHTTPLQPRALDPMRRMGCVRRWR